MAKPKVLLVDDTRLILELMKNSLKMSPVDVVTAGDGAEALDMIRKNAPDLIFMDVNMPKLGGIECCTILKADPFLSEIPIVMLTSAGDEETRERCRQAGCDDFLTKPIDRQLFLAKARHFIAVVERRDIRVRCTLPLVFRIDGAPLNGVSGDVSEGGIYIASEREVKVAETLELAYFLPNPETEMVASFGMVSWINSGTDRLKPELPIGFGVKYLDLANGHQMNIRKFVAGQRK